MDQDFSKILKLREGVSVNQDFAYKIGRLLAQISVGVRLDEEHSVFTRFPVAFGSNDVATE